MFDFITKLWAWLDGKKTVLSAVLDLLAAAATFAGLVLPVFGVSAVAVAAVLAKIGLVIGLLHKLAKFLGWE